MVCCIGAMQLDPAEMSGIMIETIASYAKTSRPRYLRLVEVVIYEECSSMLTPFREKMRQYSNVGKFWSFISDIKIFIASLSSNTLLCKVFFDI